MNPKLKGRWLSESRLMRGRDMRQRKLLIKIEASDNVLMCESKDGIWGTPYKCRLMGDEIWEGYKPLLLVMEVSESELLLASLTTSKGYTMKKLPPKFIL